MNKKVIILIVIFLLSATLIIGMEISKNMIINSKNNDTPYILTVKEDHLALYKNGTIVKNFESVNFHSLPIYDRNQLKKGIEFDSLENVYKAIEDYDG